MSRDKGMCIYISSFVGIDAIVRTFPESKSKHKYFFILDAPDWAWLYNYCTKLNEKEVISNIGALLPNYIESSLLQCEQSNTLNSWLFEAIRNKYNSVILSFSYFKFLLFPITVEWSGEGKEACTYEMI